MRSGSGDQWQHRRPIIPKCSAVHCSAPPTTGSYKLSMASTDRARSPQTEQTNLQRPCKLS